MLESHHVGCVHVLQEAWICDLPGEVSSSIQTSLQYANFFYPDADSLKPTNIVCVVGNATKGEQLIDNCLHAA